MPSVQSAYRQGHSTESALMKVIAECRHRKVTLLGLLDMSAAFDTVDHGILLRRLKVSYGIDGQTFILPSSHHVWSPARLNSWTVVILNIHK